MSSKLRKSFSKAIILTALSTVCITPESVTASSLKDRFNAATTSAGPGTYDVMGKTVHQGGYARIRFGGSGPLQPVKFQQPSFDGGCNGFDLFGGSFSYIGEDEFLEWIRNVATQTAVVGTYMFLTYLQETCATCKEVMTGLYAMQDAINQTFGGSCETAKGLAGGISTIFTGGENEDWDLLKTKTNDSISRFGIAAGSFEDAAQAKSIVQTDNATAAADAIPDAEKRARTLGGNALYWAIKDADLVDEFKPIFGTNITEQSLHMVLTYFAGNIVLKPHDSKYVVSPSASKDLMKVVDGTFLAEVPELSTFTGSFGTDLATPTVALGSALTQFVPFTKDFTCNMTGVDENGTACPGKKGVLNVIGRSKEELPGYNFDSSPEKDFMTSLDVGYPLIGQLYTLKKSPGIMETYYNCQANTMKLDYNRGQVITILNQLRDALDRVKDVESLLVNDYKAQIDKEIEETRKNFAALMKTAKEESCDTNSQYLDALNILNSSK